MTLRPRQPQPHAPARRRARWAQPGRSRGKLAAQSEGTLPGQPLAGGPGRKSAQAVSSPAPFPPRTRPPPLPHPRVTCREHVILEGRSLFWGPWTPAKHLDELQGNHWIFSFKLRRICAAMFLYTFFCGKWGYVQRSLTPKWLRNPQDLIKVTHDSSQLGGWSSLRPPAKCLPGRGFQNERSACCASMPLWALPVREFNSHDDPTTRYYHPTEQMEHEKARAQRHSSSGSKTSHNKIRLFAFVHVSHLPDLSSRLTFTWVREKRSTSAWLPSRRQTPPTLTPQEKTLSAAEAGAGALDILSQARTGFVILKVSIDQ